MIKALPINRKHSLFVFVCWCAKVLSPSVVIDCVALAASVLYRIYFRSTQPGREQNDDKWKRHGKPNGMSPDSAKWFGNKIVHKFLRRRRDRRDINLLHQNPTASMHFKTKILFIWINFQIVYFAFDSIFMLRSCRSKNNQPHSQYVIQLKLKKWRRKTYPQSKLIN